MRHGLSGSRWALEASAEERDVRGVISITTTSPFRDMGELDVCAAYDLYGLDDII
jgi:hypothetical protein